MNDPIPYSRSNDENEIDGMKRSQQFMYSLKQTFRVEIPNKLEDSKREKEEKSLGGLSFYLCSMGLHISQLTIIVTGAAVAILTIVCLFGLVIRSEIDFQIIEYVFTYYFVGFIIVSAIVLLLFLIFFAGSLFSVIGNCCVVQNIRKENFSRLVPFLFGIGITLASVSGVLMCLIAIPALLISVLSLLYYFVGIVFIPLTSFICIFFACLVVPCLIFSIIGCIKFYSTKKALSKKIVHQFMDINVQTKSVERIVQGNTEIDDVDSTKQIKRPRSYLKSTKIINWISILITGIEIIGIIVLFISFLIFLVVQFSMHFFPQTFPELNLINDILFIGIPSGIILFSLVMIFISLFFSFGGFLCFSRINLTNYRNPSISGSSFLISCVLQSISSIAIALSVAVIIIYGFVDLFSTGASTFACIFFIFFGVTVIPGLTFNISMTVASYRINAHKKELEKQQEVELNANVVDKQENSNLDVPPMQEQPSCQNLNENVKS